MAYDTVPPSFGPHRPIPAPFERKFYTAEDLPEIETLVPRRLRLGRRLRRVPGRDARRPVALGRQRGQVQMCGQVSGEAVNGFIDAYPSTDAPEPNGA